MNPWSAAIRAAAGFEISARTVEGGILFHRRPHKSHPRRVIGALRWAPWKILVLAEEYRSSLEAIERSARRAVEV